MCLNKSLKLLYNSKINTAHAKIYISITMFKLLSNNGKKNKDKKSLGFLHLLEAAFEKCSLKKLFC